MSEEILQTFDPTFLAAGDKLWWADQGTDQIGTCDKKDGGNWKVLRNNTSPMMHMRIYDEDVQKGKTKVGSNSISAAVGKSLRINVPQASCSELDAKLIRTVLRKNLRRKVILCLSGSRCSSHFLQRESTCAATTTETAPSCVCPPRPPAGPACARPDTA